MIGELERHLLVQEVTNRLLEADNERRGLELQFFRRERRAGVLKRWRTFGGRDVVIREVNARDHGERTVNITFVCLLQYLNRPYTSQTHRSGDVFIKISSYERHHNAKSQSEQRSFGQKVDHRANFTGVTSLQVGVASITSYHFGSSQTHHVSPITLPLPAIFAEIRGQCTSQCDGSTLRQCKCKQTTSVTYCYTEL